MFSFRKQAVVGDGWHRLFIPAACTLENIQKAKQVAHSTDVLATGELELPRVQKALGQFKSEVTKAFGYWPLEKIPSVDLYRKTG